MKSIVSEKGITIPTKMRDRVGITPGVVLDIRDEKGRLVAEKTAKEDPLEKWAGTGKLPFDEPSGISRCLW